MAEESGVASIKSRILTAHNFLFICYLKRSRHSVFSVIWTVSQSVSQVYNATNRFCEYSFAVIISKKTFEHRLIFFFIPYTVGVGGVI